MKQIALVTGSTRGIGKAIAFELAKSGYAVAINGRNDSPEARSVCAELTAMGTDCACFFGDVSDYATVEGWRNAIAERFGGEVTALVNNAGFAQQKLFTETAPEEWHRMMQVHLDGTYNTCRVFLPAMIRAHEGGIVNISSMWGQVGASCEVAYSTAKAGIIGLSKALAKEVGPSGVRVNAVAPGVIDTAMMNGFDEETRQALKEETPLMRLGTPLDVAQTVAFLLSDKASFITGQVIAPNGGIVI